MFINVEYNEIGVFLSSKYGLNSNIKKIDSKTLQIDVQKPIQGILSFVNRINPWIGIVLHINEINNGCLSIHYNVPMGVKLILPIIQKVFSNKIPKFLTIDQSNQKIYIQSKFETSNFGIELFDVEFEDSTAKISLGNLNF